MHTTGPWRVGDAGHTVFGPPNGKPSPETIAKVKPNNARLIAAAPELLAALIQVEEAFSGIDFEANGVGNDGTQYPALLAVRAAISKAGDK